MCSLPVVCVNGVPVARLQVTRMMMVVVTTVIQVKLKLVKNWM